MCKFEENVKLMTFENCNLFQRSFTNQGIGYTFNNEKEDLLLKKDSMSYAIILNKERNPSLMESASPKHSLQVIIENNAEEVDRYDSTRGPDMPMGDIKLKPRKISVSLHNPKEPADIRSKSFQIPLGQSTTVYITPKAREIDESGMELTESQRHCRLNEDTKALSIFNIYTRGACMFECKFKASVRRCGCQPWDYPLQANEKV